MDNTRNTSYVDETHVEFETGDALGMILAYVSLSPIFIAVALFTSFVVKRDIFSLFFFVGQVVDTLFCVIVKRALRQPRPLGTERTDYGMPSRHSEFIMFFCTYLMLFVILRYRISHARHPLRHFLEKRLSLVFLWLLGFAVCYSRVYLGYHTPEQVLVGAALGCLTGTLWFLFVNNFATPTLFPIITNSGLAKTFAMKDYSEVSDSLLLEREVISKTTSKSHSE